MCALNQKTKPKTVHAIEKLQLRNLNCFEVDLIQVLLLALFRLVSRVQVKNIQFKLYSM